ncbi:MAG: beta strand repeat-containing protein [Pyrinomonadaceae bacterium]
MFYTSLFALRAGIKVFLLIVLLSLSGFAQQTVTAVVTDYNGGWASTSSSPSTTQPNNHHNLLAFRIGTTWYSTGVNNSMIAGVSGGPGSAFTVSDWAALVPSGATAGNVGQGAASDGDVNVAVGQIYPTPSGNVVQYVSDGIKGLDVSTFANNVTGTFTFPLATIDPAAVGDGVPDILYTNAAATTSVVVTFKLYNSSGTLLATATSGAIGNLPVIGNFMDDRFDTSNGAAIVKNTKLPFRAVTIELSDFGISSAVMATATRLDMNLPGEVDPSFIAVNRNSLAVLADISGKVFEDVNYGGGSGRSFAASAGIARPNARVELYKSNGTFVSSTITDSSGNYNFHVATGDYIVRVVNSTVTSSRAGYTTALLPVQTFRTNGTSGSTVEVTNMVGGENPSLVDAGSNTTSATLSSLTTATTTPESIAAVSLGSGGISNADFGYNFDTIVNTNSTGQGSLAQFIANSNALANSGLAQNLPALVASNYSTDDEVSIFMIPAAALNGSGANAGTAVISIPVKLNITGANTKLDGRTQTANIGNSNAGLIGTGGTVGVDGLTLSKIERPEIVLKSTGSTAFGFVGNAFDLRGVAGYGASSGSSSFGIVSSGVSGKIAGNIIGGMADGSAPVATEQNAYSGITSSGQILYENNFGGYSPYVLILVGSATSTINNNEFSNMGPAYGSGRPDGDTISIQAPTVITGNLFRNFSGTYDTSGGSHLEVLSTSTVSNNTLKQAMRNNIRLLNGSAGTTVYRNIITEAHDDSGVGGNATTVTSVISENSIFNNKGLGIDLGVSTLLNDGITLNDANDSDAGPNGKLNFPVFSGVTFVNGNLLVRGCAPTGSKIELFVADGGGAAGGNRAIAGGGTASRDYGEGMKYLSTQTEGVSDFDSGTCAVTGPDGNVNTGMSAFAFSIPVPSGVVDGTFITSTATLSGATSEFSPTIDAVIQDKFSCDAKFYLVRSNASAGAMQLSNINFGSTASYADIGDLSHGFSTEAIGYRGADNYIYGIADGNKLIRVGADGTEVQLAIVAGLPAGVTDSGDIGPDGFLYVKPSGSNTSLYKIDVTSATPSAVLITLTQSIAVSDFAFNPVDGKIYAANGSTLYVIDPGSGLVTAFGSATPFTDGDSNWFDSSGNYYVLKNSNGAIYVVDVGTNGSGSGVYSIIGTASGLTRSDGAACPGASPVTLVNVGAYKSIKLTNDADGNSIPTPGDTVEYTVRYANQGLGFVRNFQVSDMLPSGLTITSAGAQTIVATGSTTSVAKNAAYTGAATGAVSNLLDGGARLGAQGTVTITIPATIDSGKTGAISNQTSASSDNLSAAVLSDNAGKTADISSALQAAPYNFAIAAGSVAQVINASVDPTVFTIASVPIVVLTKDCILPTDCTTAAQVPGTDLEYKIKFKNTGTSDALNLIVFDRVPKFTDFKLGSAAVNTATTGLTVVIEYSNDFDPLNPSSATWTYSPMSGGGGAISGYDRNVKGVRWRISSGSLPNTSPNNEGDVSFVVRIQ